jgi:hypothetical protein
VLQIKFNLCCNLIILSMFHVEATLTLARYELYRARRSCLCSSSRMAWVSVPVPVLWSDWWWLCTSHPDLEITFLQKEKVVENPRDFTIVGLAGSRIMPTLLFVNQVVVLVMSFNSIEEAKGVLELLLDLSLGFCYFSRGQIARNG